MSSNSSKAESANRKTQSRVSAPLEAKEIIPLLLAAHPNLKINFKAMFAYSQGTRTASALEHRFRPWKGDADKLRKEFPDIATETKVQTTKLPAKRSRATIDTVTSDSNDEAVQKSQVTKRTKTINQDKEKEMIKLEDDEKLQKATDCIKEIPPKARVQKKGTARVVRKPRLTKGPRWTEEDEGLGSSIGETGTQKDAEATSEFFCLNKNFDLGSSAYDAEDLSSA